MVGLESALSVVQQSVVDTGALSWADVARVLSRDPCRDRPAGRLRRSVRGRFSRAPHARRPATVRASSASSACTGKSLNSPYLGRELPGRVVATIHGGIPTVLDGVLRDAGGGGPWIGSCIGVAILAVVAARLPAAGPQLARTARSAGRHRRARAPSRRLRYPTFTDDLLYVATTRADAPLDRVTIAGLGFRARAVVTTAPSGIVLDLAGRGPVFISKAAIRGVGRATWTIDRVVDADGLIFVRWVLGTTELDSYLRSTDPDRLVTALTALAPAPSDTEAIS